MKISWIFKVLCIWAANASLAYAAEAFCRASEVAVFACGLKVGNLSVCAIRDDTLVFRLWEHDALQEVISPVRYSRVGYSGGGEANLTFQEDALQFIVYSKITKGERLADGTSEVIEKAGIYVVKKEAVIENRVCATYPMGVAFGDLPPHKEEEFQFYQ